MDQNQSDKSARAELPKALSWSQKTSKTARKKLFLFIFVIILIPLFIGIISILSSRFTINENRKQDSEIVNTVAVNVKNEVIKNVFIDHIDNFDSLSEKDFLYFFPEVRAVYQYKEHQLIAGLNWIVEYDPKNKNIVRQLNPTVFGCVNSVAKVNNFLFIFCGNSSKQIKRGIYKLDLSSGNITSEYFDSYEDPEVVNYSKQSSSKPYFVNSELFNQNGKILILNDFNFVNGNSLITKIDPVSNEIKIIPQDQLPKELGIPGCLDGRLVKVNTNLFDGIRSCKKIFIQTKNGWIESPLIPFEFKNYEIVSYSPSFIYFKLAQDNVWKSYAYDISNKNWKLVTSIPKDTVPIKNIAPQAEYKFIDEENRIISRDMGFLKSYYPLEKINSQYNLLAGDGIYVLKKGEFPKKIYDLKINAPIPPELLHVDSRKRFVILIGRYAGNFQPYKLSDSVYVKLLDLKTGSESDLVDSISSPNAILSEKQFTDLYNTFNKIITSKIEETNAGLQFKDKETGEKTGEINYEDKNIKFENAIWSPN